MKKWMIAIVVLALLAGGAFLAASRGKTNAASLQVTPTLSAVKASNKVIASARVVPVRSADLSLPSGGIVAEVLVAEGDHVEAGQVLVRLDAARQTAAITQAEANLAMAQAQLAKAKAGPIAEDVAVAEAGVEVARTGITTTQGAVAAAQANLARIRAGASADDLAIAQRRVEEAKNALWGAQTQRDSLCGQVGKAVLQSDCDGAQAGVQRSEEELHIAELQLQQLQSGARKEDIAAAYAQLQQAEGQLSTAQAQVRQAEANLARAKRGPTAEDIAIAQAQVEQAQAGLKQAQVALAETELRAPFAGSVVSLAVKAGEQVTPGSLIVRLADLSAWQIETDDLTELNVVRIQPGDPVTITFDALPDLTLPGTITRINQFGQNRQGDIVYTVTITPNQHEERLHWNMTASVSIEPQH